MVLEGEPLSESLQNSRTILLSKLRLSPRTQGWHPQPTEVSGYNCGVAEPGDLLFEVQTPLGFRIRIASARWNLITSVKHPAMLGRELEVKDALEVPDEVRQSRSNETVLLFYKSVAVRRGVCAVVKRLDDEGFLITAYPTDAIKEGAKIWPK